MDPLALLDRSAACFEARLELVRPEQWDLPTPCTEWHVRALVNHVVTANLTSERLLHGASRADVTALIGADLLGDAPADALRRAADAQAVAFREPGALERVVPHPAFDMRAAQLLEFRIGDMLLHTWDLAPAPSASPRPSIPSSWRSSGSPSRRWPTGCGRAARSGRVRATRPRTRRWRHACWICREGGPDGLET